MALVESALSELCAAIDVGQGGDVIRQLAEWALQQLIEAQTSERVGAGRYERSDERVTAHNGHRPRVLSTKAGDLNLKIPKLREGVVLPGGARAAPTDRPGLYAVVMEAYVLGVSTRSVDDLVAALGVDTGISRSQVSRICADLDVRVAAFRQPHSPDRPGSSDVRGKANLSTGDRAVPRQPDAMKFPRLLGREWHASGHRAATDRRSRALEHGTVRRRSGG